MVSKVITAGFLGGGKAELLGGIGRQFGWSCQGLIRILGPIQPKIMGIVIGVLELDENLGARRYGNRSAVKGL
ncbi:MAG: hypothetical protein R6V86_07045 [Spirochaetia bacterium]